MFNTSIKADLKQIVEVRRNLEAFRKGVQREQRPFFRKAGNEVRKDLSKAAKGYLGSRHSNKVRATDWRVKVYTDKKSFRQVVWVQYRVPAKWTIQSGKFSGRPGFTQLLLWLLYGTKNTRAAYRGSKPLSDVIASKKAPDVMRSLDKFVKGLIDK